VGFREIEGWLPFLKIRKIRRNKRWQGRSLSGPSPMLTLEQ